MPENYKPSARKVEEDITLYKRERFEHHMSQADKGRITRKMAIKAMEDECNWADLEDASPTQELSPEQMQRLLDGTEEPL